MSSRTMLSGVPAAIQTRLEAAGLRRTLATRAVLGLFLAQPQGGLTHAQALNALTARGLEINRVTLYRLLDRLAACGVLQRHTDDQARTWRFSLAPVDEEGLQPHFECGACHRQFALGNAGEMARELLRVIARQGHIGEQVAVRGTCSDCTHNF
ncbi:Fur family transcriptional regulator [Hydrogenophaga sp. 2FB]|uniref:Fur family transcriptional regulator n=1 Tax=Hydrogenophaga sp. 2FB TaxID=2502187 RepID=UPI0010F9AAFC|nr:Fur family transcriptional regulator [Hydrogenophaga sp. 2FB]